ncbi:MAG TPA: rhodanese-related sulfurtransferase [Leptolyngbyaceae cyanobacterium M33_DOE_097]|uniref:Rhodanese-related sulfurtransferase n=1 Tax=Oscillatoriales cyanobacterium SpSt-418 TaxID=2282169 RepID=A0A7C3PIL5_9CYAN|nr:rhodanese-related sulfurtransferase [Leptolyngbyaceae cyanobacterium M33_DOE_097]
MYSSDLPHITVQQLAERLSASLDDVQLIDVREPYEIELAQIAGFKNYPLSAFEHWGSHISTELDPHAETLVLCHHGMRSAQMCQWLINQGFTNVKNISGGIDAYSIKVDPETPRY